MMMGRDESMPNNVREPDITSEERDLARLHATEIVAMSRGDGFGGVGLGAKAAIAMARAVLRYVPAGVPASTPHPVAAVDDQTRRVVTPAGLPAAGVICAPIEPERSDGVVEPSDDGEGTRRVGDLGLTRAISIRCDECAPEWGCFDGSEPCHKAPIDHTRR